MKRTIAISAASLIVAGGLAFAAGQYGPGASDTEIKSATRCPMRAGFPYGVRQVGGSELRDDNAGRH